LEENFWEDRERAQAVTQMLSMQKEKLAAFSSLESTWQDINDLMELALEEDEQGLEKELTRHLDELEEAVSAMELETLLSGPYDRNNAFLTLHAGAGGTEAQDWAQMLMRMYVRFAEQNGFQVQTVDILPCDEAGIKSVTLLIKGENAYGYLRAEKGVHRLVRISPFDASGRRHTSFASVECMPEVDESMEVTIDPGDLKIDTYRAGGAGGQHVNKTDSAVRITHLPTGIVVQCQNERSQHANRLVAMRMLQSKLLELEVQKKEEELAQLRGEQREIAWGSQIRSYVFHPYSLVKDHRTNLENGNIGAVMDGDILPFIRAYLKEQARQKI
jgi:peptide chain release factor 2